MFYSKSLEFIHLVELKLYALGLVTPHFPLSLGPDNHHSTLWFYEFDSYKYLIWEVYFFFLQNFFSRKTVQKSSELSFCSTQGKRKIKWTIRGGGSCESLCVSSLSSFTDRIIYIYDVWGLYVLTICRYDTFSLEPTVLNHV